MTIPAAIDAIGFLQMPSYEMRRCVAIKCECPINLDAISTYVGIAEDDYALKLAVFHTIFNVLGPLTNPAGAQRRDLHPGGIEDAHCVGQMPARTATGAGCHMGEQIAIQCSRPAGIGIGQRGTRHAASANMVEPGRMADQPCLDLAQARRTGQLPEQQRQELAFAGQTPDPIVGPVLVHKPFKNVPRNVLQNLMKNAIVMPHDIDLLLVSQTPRNV